jgi:hypothetical protein
VGVYCAFNDRTPGFSGARLAVGGGWPIQCGAWEEAGEATPDRIVLRKLMGVGYAGPMLRSQSLSIPMRGLVSGSTDSRPRRCQNVFRDPNSGGPLGGPPRPERKNGLAPRES